MTALTIIDGGPGWVVVDKPRGLSVHNQPGRDLMSLIEGQLKGDAALAERLAYQPGTVMGPVHRLDRETSGLILLGLNPEISRWFSVQFEQRRVGKHYLALVHGHFDQMEALWDSPLSPEAGGRNNPEGKGKKVPCLTRVRVMDQSPHYALIACSLMTGRKHQIRRHAKLAGHPVLGDERYGSKRAVDYVRTQAGFNRLGLHAHLLELALPGRSDIRTFTSPMPQEFVEMIDGDKDR